ncbi:MAG TPA: Fic family protein [Allosphingosinicella sp.]|nr:Fic family protein [Allosphingosinicella sp.]
MNPDWDESSPQLAANIVRVLGAARAHASERKEVSVALMRDWHGDIMAGLGMRHPGWAACFRGEGAAKGIGVSIGSRDGAAPAKVAAELEAFEARLVQIVATLDSAIGKDGADSEDEIGALIDSCAWAHGEWVRIHPFVNGSGRTARLWVNYLAMRYGLPRFARMRPRPGHAYAWAANAGMAGNWKAMIPVFHAMLSEALPPEAPEEEGRGI